MLSPFLLYRHYPSMKSFWFPQNMLPCKYLASIHKMLFAWLTHKFKIISLISNSFYTVSAFDLTKIDYICKGSAWLTSFFSYRLQSFLVFKLDGFILITHLHLQIFIWCMLYNFWLKKMAPQQLQLVCIKDKYLIIF